MLILAAAGTPARAQTARFYTANPAQVSPAAEERFAPSNVRTADGQYIPASEFLPAARCAHCHADTHAAWSESLHRNAAREPYYKASVDLLAGSGKVEFTRHCESCHAPVAVLTGALSRNAKIPRTLDEEGVTCTVCHSITEARNEGTGSYVVSRPALLEKEDGTRIYGDLPDAAILADVGGHRRAMLKPALRTPEFCAACHKSDIPPGLNGFRYLRDFSTYDDWRHSSASQESAMTAASASGRRACAGCHMPRVSSSSDVAAKGGLIASHRWPGANMAVPLFFGDAEQAAATRKFLGSGALSVDLFAFTAGKNHVAPLPPDGARVAAEPGSDATAEVVVVNRGVGHSFPPELRDLYEAWLQFEVFDANGQTLFHSGYLNPDGSLDPDAHVFRSVLMDKEGRALDHHEIWSATATAYDNGIPAGGAALVRYRFPIPAEAFTVRARVQYRRFSQQYAEYVNERARSSLTLPVVELARAEAQLGALEHTSRTAAASSSLRWSDYGRALVSQGQLAAAVEAFQESERLAPGDPGPLVDEAAALAGMPAAAGSTAAARAIDLLNETLRKEPDNAADNAKVRLCRGTLLVQLKRFSEAEPDLRSAVGTHPRDSEALTQLGVVLQALGRTDTARAAFEAAIAVDPQNADAYHGLAVLYENEGRTKESAWALRKYMDWRGDLHDFEESARGVAARADWSLERLWSHVHRAAPYVRPARR